MMPEDIVKNDKILPWSDRNNALKIYKISGKFGWLHLIIAEEKLTGRKFLRLKRYKNWFSIPNSTSLYRIKEMIDLGANDLGWITKDNPDDKIEIIEDKHEISEALKYETEIPEQIIDLIENDPKIIEQLINLCSNRGNIAYLSEFLNILGENVVLSNERLRVAFKEVIEKISKDEEKGMMELSDLMKQWNLIQITSLSNLLKQRLETIQTFEQMIHDDRTYEINTDKSIHRILEKSMWLIDENYFLVYSNTSLRKFIEKEMKKHKEFNRKRFDFAVVDADKKLLIIEIKRPSIEISKEEIDQLELYLRIIKQYKSQSYRSIEGYLIGNKISQEAEEIMYYRKYINLMTYDDLLERCRKRYSHYLKIVE